MAKLTNMAKGYTIYMLVMPTFFMHQGFNMRSENNNDFNPENDLGYIGVLRQMAMKYAIDHLQVANRLEAENSGTIYLKHDPNSTPLEDAVVILLTRDGVTPEFEEHKELIYLYFPLIEGSVAHEDLPMLWVQHISKGKSHTFTLTNDAFEPTDLEFPADIEGWGKKIQKGIGQVAHSKRKRNRQDFKRIHRYRDLIQNFRLTPQRYNPNA